MKERSVFWRNLEFSLARLANGKTPAVLKMLEETFPHLKNFNQMRTLGEAFLSNDCKPLRKVPIPTTVDPENLSNEAALRFVDGFFYLAKTEDLVFSGAEAHGPYKDFEVAFMAKKLSAESPANDKAGHIIDPEEKIKKVTTTSSVEIGRE